MLLERICISLFKHGISGNELLCSNGQANCQKLATFDQCTCQVILFCCEQANTKLFPVVVFIHTKTIIQLKNTYIEWKQPGWNCS